MRSSSRAGWLDPVIQLSILNAEMAGRDCLARRFPFQIGRAAGAHLALPAEGVWDRHLEIHFRSGDGFHLRAHPGALVSVNGQRVEQARLRNGDLLQLGSVKLRFWLAPAAQRSLLPREALTWLALGALTAFQLIVIYRLQG